MAGWIPKDPLVRRMVALLLLLGTEVMAAMLRFDGDTPLPHGAWLAGWIHAWAPWVARWAIFFAAVFATFGYLRYRTALAGVSKRLSGVPLRRAFLAPHLVALLLFAACSFAVFGRGMPAGILNWLAAAWIVTAAATAGFIALAFIPWATWTGLARATGPLWFYSAAAALAACRATPLMQSLWKPASRLTFRLVEFVLGPLLPDLTARADQLRIGTPRFSVVIADQCSGLEGLGLLLVFALVWLVVFRQELRFPHALALVPAAAGVLFLINTLRIATLILIGNAGAPDIAVGGFHSQAGWIAFCLVSIGMVIVSKRLPWVSVQEHAPAGAASLHTRIPADRTIENPVAPFLVPFLAILAAGMLSRAASGSFEWLYSLRVVAAALVLWMFRGQYRNLNWRFGWLSPVAGAMVFALWIAFDRSAATPMAGALSVASPALRSGWIALRVLGAVITVPVAEELAFRGFALRRMVAAEFESVPFRNFTWFALLGSSVLFGLMHGDRWPVGVAAGVAYGLVAAWRGRIGDAVVAHATSNLLLAIYVLAFGQWQLW
jgi:exosortase E/protease (VPEID-CTERM system)